MAEKDYNNTPVNEQSKKNETQVLEDKVSFKVYIPQIIAAVVSVSFHIVCGIALSYSAIIIPQLHNSTHNMTDKIVISETDSSWIASSLPMMIPVGALLGGPIMDYIGRLNIIKLAAVPLAIGWVLIATAVNVPMILSGRLLCGIALAWGMSPSMVYISEVSAPQYRGALVALGPTFASLGILSGYLEGWLLHWRIVAWLCLAFAIIPVIVMQFIPPSPQWLVSKEKYEQAEKALNWFNKYYPQPSARTKMELNKLISQHELKKQEFNESDNAVVEKLKMFLLPTVYKPFLILFILNLLQQLTGVFIILFYAVSIFEEVGTNLDPFLVSIYIGVVRLGMSVVSVWLMRHFGRRPLIITSGIGMAICMCISALFTKWIQEGTSTQIWIPVIMFLLYITSSMIGFLGIPLTIISEVYPIKGRGLIQSTSVSMLYLTMFATTNSYYALKKMFGGSSGLQYFFAAGSIAGAIYSYVFLPETHNKSLAEIENYFKEYSIYLLYKKADQNGVENPVFFSQESGNPNVEISVRL